MQFLGAIIIFFTCVFVVLQRDSLDSGVIGLVITYAITTVFTLYFGVRCMAMVEANIVSIERIVEYTKIGSEVSIFFILIYKNRKSR